MRTRAVARQLDLNVEDQQNESAINFQEQSRSTSNGYVDVSQTSQGAVPRGNTNAKGARRNTWGRGRLRRPPPQRNESNGVTQNLESLVKETVQRMLSSLTTSSAPVIVGR
ncbi:hypothetical protein ACLKA6_000407 [Drosophila palustris]